MGRESTLDDYAQRILRVLEYVQANLDAAIAPADLAEIASFSPYHFQRIFRGLVGESVMGHVRRLRLERAASRLKHGDQPISHVAFDAGYDVHEAFTRAFSAHFGCSPSEFRKRHRGIAFPPAPSRVHYADDQKVDRFDPVPAEPARIDVSLRRLPAQQVAYVRHVGPYPECGRAWETLMTWVAGEGLFGPGVEMLGICHDDPDITDPARLRYDACVTIAVDFAPRGEIGRKQLRGGDHAVARHTGPYAELGRVYQELIGGWLPRSGRAPGEPYCIEKYWNDPESTPPDELETDIWLPLAS